MRGEKLAAMYGQSTERLLLLPRQGVAFYDLCSSPKTLLPLAFAERACGGRRDTIARPLCSRIEKRLNIRPQVQQELFRNFPLEIQGRRRILAGSLDK